MFCFAVILKYDSKSQVPRFEKLYFWGRAVKDLQAERTEFGAVNASNVRFGGAGVAGWRWRESKYALHSRVWSQ